MGKLVLALLLIACAYGAGRHFGYFGGRGGDIRIDGSPERGGTLVANVDGYKVTYTVNGPAQETYMVFGGDVGGNSFAHGSFSGMELASIRRIAKRYPDFHRCDSPGAPEAKRLSEHVLVVGDRAMMGKLQSAVKEAGSREQARGERLCASMQGQWLTLEQMEKGELVVTAEQYNRMIPGHATKQYFLYLQSLDARDCKDSI